MNLQSRIAEFLLACEADGLSASTMTWYRSLLGSFLEKHPDGTVSAHDVRAYLVDLRKADYSDSTLSAHTRALHRFWSWVAKEYGVENPMRNIKYPAMIEPTPRAANLDDLRAMLQAAAVSPHAERDLPMLLFLLDTGCRAGGLCGLNAEDVDIPGRRALVTEKGGKTRGVLFTPFTAMHLATWEEKRLPFKAYFYAVTTGERMTPNGLYQMLRRLAQRGGVKGRFNPHAMRHTFAREYVRSGGDLATLAKLLGHRDVSTTVRHYAIFTTEELAEAHARYSPVVKLGEMDSG